MDEPAFDGRIFTVVVIYLYQGVSHRQFTQWKDARDWYDTTIKMIGKPGAAAAVFLYNGPVLEYFMLGR